MQQEAMRARAAAVLSAWNRHDGDQVVACYTEDCISPAPNTRGAVPADGELEPSGGFDARCAKDSRTPRRIGDVTTRSRAGACGSRRRR
jgi:hypothetical protein